MNIQSSSNVNVSMAVIQKTVRESAKDDQQDGMKTKSSKFSKAINKKKEVAELSRKKADKDVEAQEESAEGSMWSGVWATAGVIGAIAAVVILGPVAAGIVGGIAAAGGLFSNAAGQYDSAKKKAEAAEFQELAATADVEALSAQDKADKAKSSVSNSRDRMKQALEINRTILSYQNNAVNEITRAVGSGGRA
ncbi:MAG: hypothetical protein VYC39_03915 [Myxococcota bacterium]|nr:hypothetical protein [Myxococcota bacterium]